MDSGSVIERPWADGRYRFRLGLSEVEEFEDKCDASIFRVYAHLTAVALGLPAWDRTDIRWKQVKELLRLGLIGGETKPGKAFALVERYMLKDPIESVTVALEIAAAFISPKKDDPVGKPSAAKDESEQPSTAKASSPSPQSTVLAP